MGIKRLFAEGILVVLFIASCSKVKDANENKKNMDSNIGSFDASEDRQADAEADSKTGSMDAAEESLKDGASGDGERLDSGENYPVCPGNTWPFPTLWMCARNSALDADGGIIFNVTDGFEVNLTVKGVPLASAPTCFVSSLGNGLFSLPLPSGIYAPQMPPTARWELEDKDGNIWIVEAQFPTMPQELLKPGDEVVLRAMVAFQHMSTNVHGYIILERQDGGLLSMIKRIGPTLPPTNPDFEIETAYTECRYRADRRCLGELAAIKVTKDGESITLKSRESGVLGRYKVYNDYYAIANINGCIPEVSPDAIYGVYRIP